MNIFEDLVEELKEENLLEETVIELNQEKERVANKAASEFFAVANEKPSAPVEEDLDAVLNEFKDILANETESLPNVALMQNFADFAETAQAGNAEQILLKSEIEYPPNAPIAPVPELQANFYTSRATDEVSGLQLVEHVFSGVEREQMKTVPKPYDDLECKKALHAFMQVSADINSPEHAQAEFRLMQETESWYSALSRRDRNISVTHLRRYCETTRPGLSSTALISLARFYRNAPFAEQVRSKFDFIVTRLMTRELNNDKRDMPFKREELIGHLKKLYSQWASIPLYTANDDDSEILLIALKFEEFMNEAESAESFDRLINDDFFSRLRAFKESTNENFFAPLVTAATIECNVRVGNRYVDLIRAEKEKFDKNVLEDKYGFLHDQAISESSSKTLQLVQILEGKVEIEEAKTVESIVEVAPKREKKESPKFAKTSKSAPAKVNKVSFQVNKWLLAATILIVVVNVGLYFWMSSGDTKDINQKPVVKVNLENSPFHEFIKEARVGNNTFFGVVGPNWASLPQAKQEDILKKIYGVGGEKGFSKAQLLNSDGRTVAYIDSQGSQVY